MKHSETVNTWNILGFTEEVTDCGCCGKSELKGTIAMELEGSGEISYFGVVCASKIASNTKKYVLEQLTEIEKQNIEKAREELRNSPEYKDYKKAMEEGEAVRLDYEKKRLDIPFELHSSIVKRNIEFGGLFRNKANVVAKKHFIKYINKITTCL